MNGSIRVGNLFGIPFFINVSWFLVLGLMTLSYGGSLSAQFPQLGLGQPLLFGFIAALLLFASVLAHELGHSFVAIKQGIDVKSITLFLFGGLASLDREATTPAGAFWIAISGPLVSLVLFALFSIIGSQLLLTGPLAAIVNLLAYINLALALFNLIPGLPLDGGNVLKAIVWKITGNQYKGILFASRFGQGFGWLAILVGFLPLLTAGTFPNVWTILIGWFLLQNARVLGRDALLRRELSEFTAADAIVRDNLVVPEQISLRQFANEYVIGQSATHRFFVTNEDGKLVGEIETSSMRNIPTSQWPSVQVQALMQPIELSTTVEAEQSLLDVIALLEQQQLTELPVVRDGAIVGLIEKSSIRRLLEQRLQPNPA